jgi:hypothetical protein
MYERLGGEIYEIKKEPQQINLLRLFLAVPRGIEPLLPG